jgi:hypothetical protein
MAVIQIPPFGGGGGGDHHTLVNLGLDDHLQYLTQARGDARVKLGLMSLLSGTVIKVHPIYIDNADLLQYGTIAAALAKAATLAAVSGPVVTVHVLPGIHTVVDTLVIAPNVALVFEQAVISISGWTGIAGNPLFEMTGYSILANPFLWNIGFAPHPFTGNSWIKVRDSASSAFALLIGVQIWDVQGGATTGVLIEDGAGAAVNAFIDGGMYSMVTSGSAVEATGNSNLQVQAGTHIAALLGTCIKCIDNVGLVGPHLSVYSTYLNNLGLPTPLIDVSPNTVIGPDAMKGSFFDLARTNIDLLTHPSVETMLNSGEIFQNEWPDLAKPDPEAYSLRSGLELARVQVLDSALGHTHGGASDDGAPVPYLMTYQAVRDMMIDVAEVYFSGMHSTNGIKVPRNGYITRVAFANDDPLTRDINIWKFHETGAVLTLLATISLAGDLSVTYIFPVPVFIDQGDHLIAALEPGVGTALNACLVMTVLAVTGP